MVGILLCVAAFVTTFTMARKSLGQGLIVVMAVGYAYGLVRARIPDIGSHFFFDSALIALYITRFSAAMSDAIRRRSDTAKAWTIALVGWPIVCMAYAPLVADTQPLVVQLVGFRAVAFVIPCLILGSRLDRDDFDRLAPAIALLNCVALAFAVLEYVFGIETFVPRSAVSEIVYATRDISTSSDTFYRIPLTFLDSHAYGSTMAISVTFVAHGLESGRRTRILCWCGLAAAGIGVFLCGSRLPVVVLIVATMYVLFSLRIRASMFVAVGIAAIGVYYLVNHVDRMQRFLTLGDTDLVSSRIRGSVNTDFFDAMVNYPLGAGLASAFGTSIPYFLASEARPQIGIENEYGHILVEQGIPGLTLWLGVIITSVVRKTSSLPGSNTAMRFLQALVVITWCTAPLGVGFLAGIPTASLILLMMGVRLAAPVTARAGRALRHVGNPRPRVSAGMPAGVRAGIRSGTAARGSSSAGTERCILSAPLAPPVAGARVACRSTFEPLERHPSRTT